MYGMTGWIDGWIDEWMNGWMDGWMDGLIIPKYKKSKDCLVT